MYELKRDRPDKEASTRAREGGWLRDSVSESCFVEKERKYFGSWSKEGGSRNPGPQDGEAEER